MMKSNSERAPGRAATRIGVIGDVHTERARLEGVLAFFARRALDAIVCTGDLPDGPRDAHDVDACCELLRAASVLSISGNHDRWLQDGEMRDLPGATLKDELASETLEFLAALPPTRELVAPDGLVLLCHGFGADDMHGVQPHDHGRALAENQALQAVLQAGRHRYVINGHTHRAMVREIEGLTIINAGTLLEDQHPCCALLDFGARLVQFYNVAADGSVSPRDNVKL